MTKNICVAHKLAGKTREAVWINCHNIFDASLPFVVLKNQDGEEKWVTSIKKLYRS